jgi:hypothetical protein
MQIVIVIVVLGGLGYLFYREMFGWWRKHRRFPSRPEAPNVDAFTAEDNNSDAK